MITEKAMSVCMLRICNFVESLAKLPCGIAASVSIFFAKQPVGPLKL